MVVEWISVMVGCGGQRPGKRWKGETTSFILLSFHFHTGSYTLTVKFVLLKECANVMKACINMSTRIRINDLCAVTTTNIEFSVRPFVVCLLHVL